MKLTFCTYFCTYLRFFIMTFANSFMMSLNITSTSAPPVPHSQLSYDEYTDRTLSEGR